jgi:hypothetical protein
LEKRHTMKCIRVECDESVLKKLGPYFQNEVLEYEGKSLNGEGKVICLQSGAGGILAPIVTSVSGIGFGEPSLLPVPVIYGKPQSEKSLIDDYIDHLDTSCSSVAVRIDPQEKVVPLVLKRLLQVGFKTSHHFTTIVRLGLPECIWAKLRKRYKSLINSVLKTWTVKISALFEPTFYRDWKTLYSICTSRGNATPNEATFAALECLHKQGIAFLYVFYANETMVSGIEILVSGGKAFYLHSATHPDYEKKEPFTHALMWSAILDLSKQGVNSLEIGPIEDGYPYVGSKSKKTQISEFKVGMGGDLMPFIQLLRKH